MAFSAGSHAVDYRIATVKGSYGNSNTIGADKRIGPAAAVFHVVPF